MLTLRHLPRAATAHPNAVLRLYYDGLLSHWGSGDRLTAQFLSRSITGGGGPAERRRLGIPAREWALAEGRLDPAQMLTMQARKGLHRLINGCAFPLRSSVLKNKHSFARAAAGCGLAIPAALDPKRDDAAAWMDGFERLILKPNFSSKGAGVLCLVRDGSGWREGGKLHKAADAAALVRRTVANCGIVQAALPTHTALAPISPAALPTMRIVTIRNESGEIEIAARVLRVGGGGAPVDNFNRGGLAAVVGDKGELGAFSRHVRKGPPAAISCHPATAAAFPSALPAGLHDDVDRLGRAAHDLIAKDYAVVGWDIGLTRDGAVLIEGNWNPGTNVTQLLTGQSVLTGRSGALYKAALERVSADGWRAARPIQRDQASAT